MPVRLSLLLGLVVVLLARLGDFPASTAAPALSVTSLGLNGNQNHQWLVEVSPDPVLFSNTHLGLGGSLAVELAFEILGSDLLTVSPHGGQWPYETLGNNPFTGTLTSGLAIDAGGGTLFASFLSDFLTAANPVEIFTLETAGCGMTTLQWGGHTLLPATPDEYLSSRIAQGGQNFSGYQGSLTVGGGDFDGDCDVDGVDFLLWQRGLGRVYMPADLATWQANFGMTSSTTVTMPVPEPATLWLLLGGCGWAALRSSKVFSLIGQRHIETK